MKAIVRSRYGSPDVLALEDVEAPSPKANEVLVKVHAASINAWDWDLLRGKPFLVRIPGLLKPKYPIPGADVAGRIEAVAAGATRFQTGDAVFGDLCQTGWGAFAEYVCAHEKALAPKPAHLTFEQAAAVPQAAVMALQGLSEHKPVVAGQRVLINGAGGGVGTFAVQIAKSLGAEVTGVDRAEKLDVMRSAGADRVIDYAQKDYTRTGQTYDLILDTAAYRPVRDCRRALGPDGVYIFVGGSLLRVFQLLLLGPWVGATSRQQMGILGIQPNKNLAALKELLDSGKVVPVIDRCYALSEVPEAFRYFGAGHAKGKLVISIADGAET